MLARLHPASIHEETFGIDSYPTLREVNKECILLVDQIFEDRVSPRVSVRAHFVIVKLYVSTDVIENLLVANLESFDIVRGFFVWSVIATQKFREFVIVQHRKKIGRNEMNGEPIVETGNKDGIIFEIPRKLTLRQVSILDSANFGSQIYGLTPLFLLDNLFHIDRHENIFALFTNPTIRVTILHNLVSKGNVRLDSIVCLQIPLDNLYPAPTRVQIKVNSVHTIFVIDSIHFVALARIHLAGPPLREHDLGMIYDPIVNQGILKSMLLKILLFFKS